MSEAYLQRIWRQQAFSPSSLQTHHQKTIVVEVAGTHNHDAGPDFLNARIRIADQLWVGHVEIHQRSSDWDRHQHQNDPAYDNVILHVVAEHDREIKTSNGRTLPTLILPESHSLALENKLIRPCIPQFNRAQRQAWENWRIELFHRRLSRKAKEVLDVFQRSNSDWEVCLHRWLARAYGMRVNAEAFEQLAIAVPLRVVQRIRSNPHQIEALVMGQAGWLSVHASTDDEHVRLLRREYHFLRQKHSLQPLPHGIWKSLRMRPSNFPEQRAGQWVALLKQSERLVSQIIEEPHLRNLLHLFSVDIDEYWQTHYRLGGKLHPRRAPGQTFYEHLIINAVLPFLFAFGKARSKPALLERAMRFATELTPEQNQRVSTFMKRGAKCQNAADTQALLELDRAYCSRENCLNCRIGVQLVK